ncbi:MAG: glycosyltransferase family 2 protein [Patescibacteria group bacterium]
MIINKVRKNSNLSIPTSLVIPVYNGELTVIEQLRLCEKILNSFTKKYEIIVADDNSRDNTSDLLKENFINNKNYKLIFNKTNIGIAKNIKNLYSQAKYEYICLYSADGDWSPYDIKKLVIHSYKNDSDIVIGKRNKRVYNPYRKIISFCYNFLPRLLFQVDTIDAGSIKVIKKTLFKKIPLLSKGVFFEAELIIRAKNERYIISSMPITFERSKLKKENGGKMKLAITSLIDLINLRLKI